MILPGADSFEKTAELALKLDDLDGYTVRIKAYRNKHRMTQEALAEKLGIKSVTLRAWEQGKAKPPHHVWRLLKHLLDDTVLFP